ncbi:MAG: peptidoglycan DD-metalloendopeptidase family protein, partial [Patescibacteria group bacterium]
AGGISFAIAKAETSISSLNDQKEALEKQDDILKAKIASYKDIIRLKSRQGATLGDQIEGLNAQVSGLELEIAQNEKKISALDNDISTLSQRVSEKSVLINQQKKILSELMRAYYSDYAGDTTPLLLSTEESVSYFNQGNWTTDVSDKVGDLLESVRTLRDSLAVEQKSLEEKKEEIDSLHMQLSEREDYLESAKNNKQALLAKTQTDISKYDSLVDDLQKQRDELDNEIENLEAGKVGDLKGLPGYKKSTLGYPVKSVRISQGYGKTSFSKRAYASGKHNGIDYTGSTGTTIMAAADGKVVGTGNLGKYAYGRWIAIDHGNGIITLYGHLSKQSVSRGAKVEKGDKIGEMGSTGYSTGTHVHFTVFSAKSYEVVESSKVKGLMIPVGATVNPNVYLP